MHSILWSYIQPFKITNDLKKDVYDFLVTNKHVETAKHSVRVGKMARRLAMTFGVDPDHAEHAGLLHDVSAVIPHNERSFVANALGISVLPEEERFQMIIHQKISRVMAESIFGVKDTDVLSAIECHTTLKANFSKMDLVVFVADKIEWDQPGLPPYIEELKSQLKISLEHAAFSYIDYLWQRRNTLKVVHPWLVDAHRELSHIIKNAIVD
ncbi:MAG: bis(5'-nucleosyl)-tetraphosphatase (symmetrical) YqeK [Brevibacillus sp.]|nr:bis(5'-nucleosyl)-tetraphosphatase (symmetrical) YqeK [Brevibacillus sp.]